METSTLKPEESLKIIEDILETERMRFAESGFIYLFWGWLIIAAAIAQFVLIQINYQHSYLVWFLMIIGSVYSGYYYSKKRKNTKPSKLSIAGRILFATWLVITLNIFIAAFLLYADFANVMLFVILSFIAFGTIISGAIYRFKPLIMGGIVGNIIAFASLHIDYGYWDLLIILAVIFSNIIPGYLLQRKYLNKNV
jgi:hypothetical protein